MRVFEFEIERCYFLRLDYGRDLIEQLLDFLENKGIRVAYVSGIGAISSAEIGYYDQVNKDYKRLEVNRRCEIVSLSGNVSVKDGRIFPHLHVVLSDEDGNVFSGHLFNAKVFASELFVVSLRGEVPERIYDETTGLALWL